MIYIYRKEDEPVPAFHGFLKFLGAENCTIFTDADRDRIAYEEMKQELKNAADGIVLCNTLTSLGNDRDSIVSELEYFIDSPFLLYFVSYPSLQSLDIKENHLTLQIMKEIILDKHTQIIVFPERAKQGAGRKKLVFPENWQQLYEQWENGEITGNEFIQRSGLKHGTFYNMVKEYRILKKRIKTVYQVKEG